MNTKFFFALLIIAIMVAACAPITETVQQPANADVEDSTPALVPVTGNSTTDIVPRDPQVPRLWSGEISASDNNNPDLQQDVQDNQVNPDQQTTECMSEDSQPRQQSGCIE